MITRSRLEAAALVVVIAVGTVLLQAAVEFDPDEIKDWHAWGIGLAVSAVRAGAVAGLALLGIGASR